MIDEKFRRIGVYGLCIREGNVLLAQVAPAHSAAKPWTLPGGGMEWGESPRETLEREFEEETGLRPRILHPLFVRSHVVDNAAVNRPIHNLQIVFEASASGVPRPEADGSTIDARWVPLGETDALRTVPLVRDALEQWESRDLSS